jgi:nucleoid-associated protein YgaU
MASFDELKQKYSAVLDKGHEVGLRVDNLQMDGDKLYVKGAVPSDYGKNQLWDAVKAVDANAADITADIAVQPGQVYTVQSGDSLSKIAKRFYGDANQYQKIFQANSDQLSDPDKIQVGQQLKLP